jgi:large subunit ribosomal protein L4e
MAAAARPTVSVQAFSDKAGAEGSVALPSVFLAPIRPDIVRFVHTSMNKNRRQPYAVNDWAGHQHSAESWGTGRAVARIPRVSGGGTSRSGQGAFGNMCRKGRMFAPTRTWRKWHKRINTNQKRFAVASALAASALPALVMARGHLIDGVKEVPLVVDAGIESVQKTRDAVALLNRIGAGSDIEKAKNSHALRTGQGKMRNRRYVARKGPLIVYASDNGISKAFRNIPGVDLVNVEKLNLLKLAPGGHLGRFIVWSRAAFDKLDSVYGAKKGYSLPTNIMANSDLTRIINSEEVQTKLVAKKQGTPRYRHKKNPLTNLGVRVKLNPYALPLRRAEILRQERAQAIASGNKQAREAALAKKRATQKSKKAFAKTHEANYQRLISE